MGFVSDNMPEQRAMRFAESAFPGQASAVVVERNLVEEAHTLARDVRWEMGEAIAIGVARGESPHEVVGLKHTDGFWTQLTNVAEDPAHRFEVDGLEVQRAVAEHGLAQVLWHSHLGDHTPSSADVQFFPDWLVAYGVVHGVSTGKSSLYDGSGVISVISPASESTRDSRVL